MAHQVWIRPYEAKRDSKLLIEWLYANREKNRFDPEVFLKGQVEIYVAFDETGTLGFIPVAKMYLVESLAFRPDLPAMTEAKALQSWQRVFVHNAAKENIGDAFFVTLDETVLKFARFYGWKDAVVPMVNLHFSSLEGVPDGRTE